MRLMNFFYGQELFKSGWGGIHCRVYRLTLLTWAGAESLNRLHHISGEHSSLTNIWFWLKGQYWRSEQRRKEERCPCWDTKKHSLSICSSTKEDQNNIWFPQHLFILLYIRKLSSTFPRYKSVPGSERRGGGEAQRQSSLKSNKI